MEFPKNASDSESLWSAFEQLEEIENVAETLENLAIPDATYRQIKDLNLALIEKAKQLAEADREIRRQKEELDLEKKSFEAIRIRCSQDSTESRLGKLLKFDQAYVDGVPLPAEDRVNPNPGLEADTPTFETLDDAGNLVADSEQNQSREILFHYDVELRDVELSNVELSDVEQSDVELSDVEQSDIGHDNARLDDLELEEDPSLGNGEREELARFQHSAENLRHKSELISAIFIELDQMVSDLSRQQELLEELKTNNNQQSASELDQVNDKLKRRFHRISRQINPQT